MVNQGYELVTQSVFMNRLYRNVCFTAYDTSVEYRERLLAEGGFSYIVFQLERCPTTGRSHIQGYAELVRRTRFNALKELFGNDVHIERRLGSAKAAADYCKKEESREEGPWENGTISNQGKRSDLQAVKEAIDAGADDEQLWDDHFGSCVRYHKSFSLYREVKRRKANEAKEVFVFYGDAGTGKTRAVYDKEGLDIFSKPDGKWFDGYEGQEVALLDDFTGDIPLGQFLKILDRYPIRVEVKGGTRKWNPKRVYVTSNLSPEEWYPNATTEQHQAIRRRLTVCTKYSRGLEPKNTARVAVKPEAVLATFRASTRGTGHTDGVVDLCSDTDSDAETETE